MHRRVRGRVFTGWSRNPRVGRRAAVCAVCGDLHGGAGRPRSLGHLLLLGVILGLVTALSHSLAYLASRWYCTTDANGGAPRGTPLQLLARAHVLLGAVALAVLPGVLEPGRLPPPGAAWLYPLGATAGFVCGQGAMFTALRLTDASRAAPMLALKIPLLALVSAAVLSRPLGGGQWLAVGLAVAAAWVLNRAGGRIPRPALLRLGAAIVSYATADACITAFIDTLGRPGDDALQRCRAAVTTACLTHLLAGAVGAALLPRVGPGRPTHWKGVLPYAAAWTCAMVSLYGTFALLGVVYGNILQSTRTLWSVLLGAALARAGWVHLEARHGRGVVAARVAAAALMVAAVVLFALSLSP